MRKMVVIGIALIALALTGCAAEGTPEVEKAASPAASAPLTAESPAAAPSGEAAYLEAVREALPADTVIPNATDEQLLAAGDEACEAIAISDDTSTVSLIEGEQANGLGYYDDSSKIIIAARATLCD